MLPAMSLAPVLVLLFIGSCSGCSCSTGKPASNQEKAPEAEGKIAVPGAKAGDTAGPPPAASTGATPDDARLHLQSDEGTITIDKAAAKPGAEATATIKLVPAAGYHVSMEYPIKLTLEAPPGIKLAKAELTAGGRNKSQGDAAALSEQGLAFAVKATADKAGAYEIKGTFKFGICQKEACHPKKQPITITVAAN